MKGAALTAGPGGQRLGTERRRGSCLARCWAGAAAGLAVGAVLGRGEKRGGQRAEIQEGRGKKILSFSISSTIFQIPF